MPPSFWFLSTFLLFVYKIFQAYLLFLAPVLESIISTRNPGYFYWRMIFWNQALGIGCIVVIVARPSEQLNNICVYTNPCIYIYQYLFLYISVSIYFANYKFILMSLNLFQYYWAYYNTLFLLGSNVTSLSHSEKPGFHHPLFIYLFIPPQYKCKAVSELLNYTTPVKNRFTYWHTLFMYSLLCLTISSQNIIFQRY